MGSEQEGSSSFFAAAWRDFWSGEGHEKKSMEQMPLGWILGGAAIILVLVVSLVALFAIRRSENAMAELLAEKGSSLIMAFESALRTGMRGGGVRLQVLLEEITRSPDIEFVAVTMPNGIIVAHSRRERLGEILRFDDEDMDAKRIAGLMPTDQPKWVVVRKYGRRVFVVYRKFTLLGSQPANPQETRKTAGLPETTIFLGLDVAPFEITNSQNRSYVAMLSVVTLIVGLVCLLAISYSQRAAEFRRRQHRAEGEVHRLEKEVRRAEKMAAIGSLAAGVAHEIRNPLSSIKGYATYFRQRFPEGSEDREAATVMVNEVNRLNRVITDLLGLSRPSDVKLRPLNPENIVAHVLHLIRQNAMRRKVSLSCRVAREVPEIAGDVERLSQALLNLCLNSLDAMPEGGELTLALSGGKKRICLMVMDNGYGMAPNVLPQIFDPYFTTKASGTGLGLPMVHKIIKAHGGEIEVKSEKAGADRPGGTVFKIWLPVAEAGT